MPILKIGKTSKNLDNRCQINSALITNENRSNDQLARNYINRKNRLPIAMLFAYSIFSNLAVPVHLQYTPCTLTLWGSHSFLLQWWLVLIFYYGRATCMLVVCPSHIFKGKPRPNRSVNFFKGDGRKMMIWHIKNAKKRASLVVAIPRAHIYVPVTEGLTLSRGYICTIF